MLFGYARVSTQEQAAEGTTSLDEQARGIQGYAMMKGVSAFDLQQFTDAGISGAMALNLRPAGHDLMQAVQPNDTIVATKLDRMFRDSFDALNCFNKFREQNINLVLLEFGIEPITSAGNVMGKVMYTIIAAFADWERERIRGRMAEGKQAKRRNGGHAGGEAPYGWQIVGSKRNAKLVPNEEELKVIEFVRSMKDLPPRAIIKFLSNNGFSTRSGRPWLPIQISRILNRLDDERQTSTH